MTEKEKMLSGILYDSNDTELVQLRCRAHNLCRTYNQLPEDATEQRETILKQLFHTDTLPPHLYLQGPVQFDYGCFTSFGAECYANFHLTVLDCCPVHIGNRVFIGPNAVIATPVHPMEAAKRNPHKKQDGKIISEEYAKPVTIGDNCWLASNVIVCAGVTIGEGCVIGAGSVVTRDIPPHTFAAGNPCRVIKPIHEPTDGIPCSG